MRFLTLLLLFGTCAAQTLYHEYYDIQIGPDDGSSFFDISALGNVSSVSTVDDWPNEGVNLTFDFKFYGHLHRKLWITPNGAITFERPYSCPDVESDLCDWPQLGAGYIRYVAPFLTNLDPKQIAASKVYYLSATTTEDVPVFIVQWTNVTVHTSDPTTLTWRNQSTFQVILREGGDMEFNYQTIGDLGGSSFHVGASDHLDLILIGGMQVVDRAPVAPLQIPSNYVQSHVTILLTARPGCGEFTDCASCTAFTAEHSSDPKFLMCGWCRESQLCSDGADREYLQLSARCQTSPQWGFIREEDVCASDLVAPTVSHTVPAANATGVPVNSNVVISFSETVQVYNDTRWLQCRPNEPCEETEEDNRNVYFIPESGDTVSISLTGNGVQWAGTDLIINTTGKLAVNKTYTFVLPQWSVVDANDNILPPNLRTISTAGPQAAASLTFSFTTTAQTNAPTPVPTLAPTPANSSAVQAPTPKFKRGDIAAISLGSVVGFLLLMLLVICLVLRARKPSNRGPGTPGSPGSGVKFHDDKDFSRESLSLGPSAAVSMGQPQQQKEHHTTVQQIGPAGASTHA